jgi:ABC-type multidrug transport system permease subunit
MCVTGPYGLPYVLFSGKGFVCIPLACAYSALFVLIFLFCIIVWRESGWIVLLLRYGIALPEVLVECVFTYDFKVYACVR